MKKRWLAFFLAVILLMPSGEMKILADEADLLTGQEYYFQETNGESLYTFKPSVSGLYRFWSYDLELGDPTIMINGENGNLFVMGDDTGDDYNFSTTAYLKKGSTYEISVSSYGDGYYQYKFQCEKIDHIKVTLKVGDGYVEGTMYEEDFYLPKTPQARVSDLPAVYPDDYTLYLAGWSKNKNASSPDLSPSYILQNGDVLYAVYKPATEIIFHAEGGYFMDEPSMDSFIMYVGIGKHPELFGIADVEKNGYYLKGWALENDRNTIVNVESVVPTSLSEIHMYAVWERVGDTSLSLKEGVEAHVDGQNIQYSFTPTKTGCYAFFPDGEGQEDAFFCLYDSDKNMIHSGFERDYSIASKVSAKLTAGKTYYLMASSYGKIPLSYDIAVLPAFKVILDAGEKGYYFEDGYYEDMDEDEELDAQVSSIEDYLYAGEDVYSLMTPYIGDNRDVFAGWASEKNATVPDISPQSELKDGQRLYAVYRNWKERSLSMAVVSDIKNQSFTGDAIKPAFIVWFAGEQLMEGADYSASFKNNVNAGTATITLTGMGEYTGSRSVTFNIKPVSLKAAKVTGIKTKTYTGKKLSQKPTVTLNGIKLVKGTDYVLKYKNNKASGKATVTIKGTGNYKGSIKKSFYIKPAAVKIKSLKNSASRTMTVKWAKVKTGDGYQIQYAVKKSMKGAKKVKISSLKTTSKKIKKLKKGKTYYVRVRVYKKVGSKTLYSGWSQIKKVKIKK